MTNVLTNLDRFFAELSAKDAKLMTPFVIVLVAAIIAAISAMMMMDVMASSLPAEAAAFADIGAAVGAIGGLIMQFIMWLLYAGVFYVISMFFGGEGSFKRSLEFIGYGFIPSIVGAIIGLVVMMTVLPTIEFSIENPELFQQALMNNPTMQASAVLGIFLMLWSANIWIFAIKHARNLSTRNALITVGVPVGIYLLYSISMMYKMGI
uniref:Yip1 domain-containing protein n=1 Tax=Candidatus Methanogaster sp. ANME-2c ERB4 TaxID=2759911 RepID=A0A7G9Y306_9EURY|nr:hypothetical protein LFOPHFOE_00030 [Methanosarcinales archaeon ANME-2c ERB4]